VKPAVVFGLLALAAAFAPLPARFVDTLYSSRLYRALQPPVTSASNAIPFALLDAAIVLVLLLWIAGIARDARAGIGHAAIRAILRTAAWGGAAYLGFLLLWGFNYRRVPIADTLQFDSSAVTRDAARRVAAVAVSQLNTLAADAHQRGWPPTADIDPALESGLARALQDLGLAMPRVARPKRTVLDLYFRRAGVQGMTDPFFLETLVVSDLLPFERPMVVAHEWSHLAGLADESAANFAGWLACIHGSTADQYSGWLFLYEELASALPRDDRAPLAESLGAVPRADLAAARARILSNVQPRVSAVAWRAYDSYLKSNRVASGTRSYEEVVRLVLGTEFAADWTPRRR
jgi:hypothetical protein